MLDLTLLTKEQILGDNSLEVLKKYDTTCGITDFAILLGGFVSPDYHTREGNSLKNRTYSWWSKTPDEYGEIYAVTRNGQFDTVISTSRLESIRPAVKYSSISNGQTQENKGIKEVIYGEYPQWVVDQDNSKILEKMYNNGKLKTTGKSYTTDSVNYLDRSENFKARSYIEYEYNGEKFIRFTGNSNCDGKTLSDRRIAKKDEVYWVKVEPLVWLVDEIEDVAFTKYAIVAGVKFRDRDNEEKTVEFESSNLKWFLDKYLSKDILTLKEKNQISSTTDDIDSLFEEAITCMNEINDNKNILKAHGLDKESMSEFRNKIETISEDNQNKLGKQIYRLVSDYFSNQEEVLKLILQGANVNITDKEKATSLHVCAYYKKLNTAILLLRAGIDFNKKDNEGNTALHYCAENDFLELLEILFLMGANINEKNIYGETPLMIAEENKSKKCHKKLIEMGAVDVLKGETEKNTENIDAIFEEAAKKLTKSKK